MLTSPPPSLPPNIYFLTSSPGGLHSQCDIASVSAKTKPTYHNKADIKYNATQQHSSDPRHQMSPRTNNAEIRLASWYQSLQVTSWNHCSNHCSTHWLSQLLLFKFCIPCLGWPCPGLPDKNEMRGLGAGAGLNHLVILKSIIVHGLYWRLQNEVKWCDYNHYIAPVVWDCHTSESNNRRVFKTEL